MNDRELFIHRMNIIEDHGGELEPGVLFHTGTLRENLPDDEEIKEQDRRFIRYGRVFAEWYTDEYIGITEKSHWWNHIAKIVEGEYPLDKLPDHVRGIAKELYYD